MQIAPSTSQERRLLFIETLLNATSKVSKVSNNSVLSGVAGAVGKISGKAEKDIVLALSELFPELSAGELLDRAAKNLGFTQRLGALSSTTYVRVYGNANTAYTPGTHTFTSTEGIVFDVVSLTVIGNAGFAYVPVVSKITGEAANVAPLTITRVNPQPSGHKYCINEWGATYGRDVESDELFRARIKDGGNLLAKSTLSMIEQVALSINPRVLKAFNYGSNSSGKRVIALASQNGQDFTQPELTALQNGVAEFLPLTDSQWWGTSYVGLNFINVRYQPVDISFRVALQDSYNPDDVRKGIQIKIAKYLDFRSFDPSKQLVEWDNLLELVKSTDGVKYVPDQYFFPRADIGVGIYKLPRLRGFLMMDMSGSIISNIQGTLSPVFYPSQADFNYQSTVLQKI